MGKTVLALRVSDLMEKYSPYLVIPQTLIERLLYTLDMHE